MLGSGGQCSYYRNNVHITLLDVSVGGTVMQCNTMTSIGADVNTLVISDTSFLCLSVCDVIALVVHHARYMYFFSVMVNDVITLVIRHMHRSFALQRLTSSLQLFITRVTSFARGK